MFLSSRPITLSGCSGPVASHDEAVQSITSATQDDKRLASTWSAAESGGLVDDGWIQSFNDPQLLQLVSEAEANNFGLKISAARLQQAEALARQAGAALKPSVGLSGAYSDRNSDALGELYGGGLKISWEADVWGRVGSAVAGAQEGAEASRSDYEFARQSLAAATANGWFLANGSKVLTDYANEVVQLLEQTVKIATTKESVGQGTM